MTNKNNNYDLIIIGAGPAGLAASIYASRYNINHLVIGSQLGGLMSISWKVENYPGFKQVKGAELTEKMRLKTRIDTGGFVDFG